MTEDQRIEELKVQIARIESVDLLSVPQPVLESMLVDVLHDYLHRDCICSLDALFRVRLNDGETLFSHAKELMAPQPHHVQQRGRFNGVGEPRFYCSSAANTAMFEPRVEAGQLMTVLVMGTRTAESRLTLAPIGLHLTQSGAPSDLQHYRVNEDFAASLKRKGLSRQWLLQDEFLCRLATTEFDPTEAVARYRLSAAVARGFESEDGVEGLIYPGVASDHHGMNISAFPEAIERNYFPTEAWQLRVSEKSSQWAWLMGRKEFFFAFERVSKVIHPDGSIEWTDLGESQPPIDMLNRAGDRVEKWREKLAGGDPWGECDTANAISS